MEHIIRRPISGGTNNGRRPEKYAYWRVGYGTAESFNLDFWIERAGEFHSKPGPYLTTTADHPNSTQFYHHLTGEATVEWNGRSQAVIPGDLFIIPPGYSFAYRAPQAIKYHWLAIDDHWPMVLGHPMIPSLLSLGRDTEVEARFVELREVLILQKAGYPLQAVGLFYELMARIAQRSHPVHTKESEYPEVVRSAIIYLRENYASPYDAAATARAVAVSESHLRALFERWVGQSPHQFHTHCRIDQARRLLADQNMPVSEVALQVGFTDGRYFSRVFKQFVGVTPSQYADNNKQYSAQTTY